MSENDVGMILGALSEAKAEHGRQLGRLFAKMEALETGQAEAKATLAALYKHGCTVGEAHAQAIAEHATAIRAIQASPRRVLFGAAGGGAGGVGLVWAIVELMQKLFGG